MTKALKVHHYCTLMSETLISSKQTPPSSKNRFLLSRCELFEEVNSLFIIISLPEKLNHLIFASLLDFVGTKEPLPVATTSYRQWASAGKLESSQCWNPLVKLDTPQLLAGGSISADLTHGRWLHGCPLGSDGSITSSCLLWTHKEALNQKTRW